jgi:hypothetical protein
MHTDKRLERSGAHARKGLFDRLANANYERASAAPSVPSTRTRVFWLRGRSPRGR